MALVALAGCSDDARPRQEVKVTTVPAVQRETVAIEKRTIVSATKLKGVVEPVPATSVVAPAAGTMRLRDLRDLADSSVAAGDRLATVELPCESPAADAPTGEGDAIEGDQVTATTTPCRGQLVPLDAPTAGRLELAPPIARAVQRGDAAVEVADGDEVASIAPGGWRLRLPLADDDQPARFVDPPPLAYALLPGTTDPTFQARFDRLDYGDDGSVSAIATPVDPPELVRGAKVTVSFVTDRRVDVPALPLSAVRSTGNVGRVLVLAKGKTRTKSVIVGPNDGSWVEVQGLDADDQVVRYPLEGELGDP